MSIREMLCLITGRYYYFQLYQRKQGPERNTLFSTDVTTCVLQNQEKYLSLLIQNPMSSCHFCGNRKSGYPVPFFCPFHSPAKALLSIFPHFPVFQKGNFYLAPHSSLEIKSNLTSGFAFEYTWSLTCDGLTYNFLALLWCESNAHSVETMLSVLLFSQAIFMWCDARL